MSEFQEHDRVILVYGEGCCFEEKLNGKTGVLHLLEGDPYYLGFVALDVPYTEHGIELNAVDVQTGFIRKSENAQTSYNTEVIVDHVTGELKTPKY